MKRLPLLTGVLGMVPLPALAQHHDHVVPPMATPGEPVPSASVAMRSVAHAPIEPKAPIAVPTAADRAAAFPVLATDHGHGLPNITLINFDRLEIWNDKGKIGTAWELTSWTGSDVQRFWIRSSGTKESGKTSGNVEFLYGHAKGAWWDVVGGIRQDFGLGKNQQTWAAVGIQGLAPYMFEVSATAYLSTTGQTMVRAEAEYDLLLTNRLILQPGVELRAYGRDDRQRLQGAGPSAIEAGTRLRYRITRVVAPYVGVSIERALGSTADYQRRAGHTSVDTRLVFSINVWF